jgi:cation diffusion facilitator family transporter
MHTSDLSTWQHRHVFLGLSHRRNERKAWAVMALTLAMMVVELVAGSVFGSMALIADGWHMATHAGALAITALAYVYARRHADDPAYTFGTGKFGDLAGFTSAVILAVISLMIGYQSIGRLLAPVGIAFDEAIAVAVMGLVVNLVSAYLLHERMEPREHRHDHASERVGGHRHASDHDHGHAHRHHHRDFNLRSAHLHVLADGLTSVLAIVALVTGRAYGWVWMDPVMGIAGSIVIARWSYGLIRDTTKILLDAQAGPKLAEEIRRTLEAEHGDRVADLHLWRIGPGHVAAIVSIVTDHPRPAAEFKRRLGRFPEIAHLTVEVQACPTREA